MENKIHTQKSVFEKCTLQFGEHSKTLCTKWQLIQSVMNLKTDSNIIWNLILKALSWTIYIRSCLNLHNLPRYWYLQIWMDQKHGPSKLFDQNIDKSEKWQPQKHICKPMLSDTMEKHFQEYSIYILYYQFWFSKRMWSETTHINPHYDNHRKNVCANVV